jgi:hypothetical protein
VSYSIYLCLFVYSIFLFVFLLVSCVPNVDSLIWIVHFLIAPSVFSNVYLQFNLDCPFFDCPFDLL